MIYFTSDTHFFHRKMTEIRGYATISDMNESLISDWNRTVSPRDTVYHLGDLSFARDLKDTENVLKRLNGKMILIRGNHDYKIPRDIEVYDYKELRYGKEKFVLCHYPMVVWNKSHYGSYMLHGHCHASMNELNKGVRRLDVGVDSVGPPISIDEVRVRLEPGSYSYHH